MIDAVQGCILFEEFIFIRVQLLYLCSLFDLQQTQNDESKMKNKLLSSTDQAFKTQTERTFKIKLYMS